MSSKNSQTQWLEEKKTTRHTMVGQALHRMLCITRTRNNHGINSVDPKLQ